MDDNLQKLFNKVGRKRGSFEPNVFSNSIDGTYEPIIMGKSNTGAITSLKMLIIDKLSKKESFRIIMNEKDYFAEFENFIRKELEIGLGGISFKGDKVSILYNPNEEEKVPEYIWFKDNLNTGTSEFCFDIENEYRELVKNLDEDTLVLHRMLSGECGEKIQELANKMVVGGRKYNNVSVITSANFSEVKANWEKHCKHIK